MKKKKILLIGWDAADWKVINPLMDQGLLPNIESLVNRGVIGNLATLDPPLSPTLWTSISTGKRPYKHGILGFTEVQPDGKGVRPAQITSRKGRAIWNILSHHGYKCHQVGWWPSHPAEPINGISISNFYQRATRPIHEDWPMLPGTVSPKSKADFFAKLRVHPSELTAAHLLPFVPLAAEVDQQTDKRLTAVAKILADCSTIHAAATYIMEHEEWDFLAVYYDAIDHFGHGFMKYHPPKREHIPEEHYRLYHNVVNAGYRFHDLMLGRLLELAGDDTHIILISDHGFHPDHLRPRVIPKVPAGPAIEHRNLGIICAAGNDFKEDQRVYGATLLDITPTILAMCGLPVGKDMDGKVLVNLFRNPGKITMIDSWDTVEGDFYEHPKTPVTSDPSDNAAVMQQLIDLGYIEDPGSDIQAAITRTRNENNYYKARSYLDHNKFEEAKEILEKLYADQPGVHRYGIPLLQCHLHLKELKKAREIHDQLDSKLDRNSAQLEMLRVSLLLAENRPIKALEILQKVESEVETDHNLILQIAKAYFRMFKYSQARVAALRALEIDPESAQTLYLLGAIEKRELNFDGAADYLLRAIGIRFQFPSAHFHLGEVLFKQKKYAEAAQAFEISLRMVPGLFRARMRLAELYDEHLNRPELASRYRESVPAYLRGTITVVSGLPRSGTSMMMQMLDRGGLKIFTDRERRPDESNPKGYYEHSKVKNLKKDKAFMKDAVDQGIKVVAPLLSELPNAFYYKIIFMERNLDEIVTSQHTMLAREGKLKKDVYPLRLRKNFEDQLSRIKDWIPKQANMEVMYVNYEDVLSKPFETALNINTFLNYVLQPELMVQAVDPGLYRTKSVSQSPDG